MRIDRLQAMSKFLRNLHEPEFNYGTIVEQVTKTTTKCGTVCGTVCCAVGWLPKIDPVYWQWRETTNMFRFTDSGKELAIKELVVCRHTDTDDYIVPNKTASTVRRLWTDVASYLEITPNDVRELFFGGEDTYGDDFTLEDITKEMVADAIDMFISDKS